MPTGGGRREARKLARKQRHHVPAEPIQFSWKTILIIASVLVGAVLLTIILTMPLYSGIKMRNRIGEKTDEATTKGKDTNDIWKEHHTNYPRKILQSGYCPKQNVTAALNPPSCSVVTPKEILKRLNAVEIVAHKNHVPAQISFVESLRFHHMYDKPNNKLQFKQRLIPDDQALTFFKELMLHSLSKSSYPARKLAEIFLSNTNIKIIIFNNYPYTSNPIESLSARYDYTKGALCFFHDRPAAQLVAHETAHGAADRMSNGDEVGHTDMQMMSAFPCMTDKFLSLWQKEMNEIIAMNELLEQPSAVLSSEQKTLMKKLQQAAAFFEPFFDIIIREDELERLQKTHALKLGKNINLNNLSEGEKFVYSMDGVMTDKNMIDKLIFQSKTVLQGFNYYTDVPGLAMIQVAPELSLNLKIHYLMSLFKAHLKYINNTHPLAKCQEIFATLFEKKNDNVFNILFPETCAYLSTELAKYEEKNTASVTRLQA